ncbi:uncharacterized protein LOC6540760 [Drosophila erecta]|uniref:CG33306 protein n=1 Tax=Drosophila erecta TaxID=7220 RepID=B3NAC2_DROER|nr:uncharacterized protein LOC6540760 [Drosophila erecta]EDV58624.1 uncharacterized protein Dere_GG10176 [Drosophila erecta]
MKSVFLITLIVALGSCQGAEVAEPLSAQERSISSVIVDGLEAFRGVLQNGSPKHGLPVLAPMKAAKRSFEINSGEFSGTFGVENFELQGLDQYEIITMNMDVIRSRLTFNINFASLNFTTDYEVDMGSGYRIKRNGGAFFALEDLNIQGKISYSLGVFTSQLRVKDVLIYPSVGNVNSQIENLSQYRIFNRKLNEIIEEFVTLTINENTDFVADWVSEQATPICNDLIGDRTLSDIIAIITGGN